MSNGARETGRQTVQKLRFFSLNVYKKSCSTVLKQKASWTFECCQISSDELFIFGESCEYSSSKFSGILDMITIEILEKLYRKKWIGFLENP